jgi:hypothetical protein
MKIKIRDSTTQRIAQQLIEHLEPVHLPSDPSLGQPPPPLNLDGKDAFHSATMMPVVSLEELKSELERSQKKLPRNLSPIEQRCTTNATSTNQHLEMGPHGGCGNARTHVGSGGQIDLHYGSTMHESKSLYGYNNLKEVRQPLEKHAEDGYLRNKSIG